MHESTLDNSTSINIYVKRVSLYYRFPCDELNVSPPVFVGNKHSAYVQCLRACTPEDEEWRGRQNTFIACSSGGVPTRVEKRPHNALLAFCRVCLGDIAENAVFNVLIYINFETYRSHMTGILVLLLTNFTNFYEFSDALIITGWFFQKEEGILCIISYGH